MNKTPLEVWTDRTLSEAVARSLQASNQQTTESLFIPYIPLFRLRASFHWAPQNLHFFQC